MYNPHLFLTCHMCIQDYNLLKIQMTYLLIYVIFFFFMVNFGFLVPYRFPIKLDPFIQVPSTRTQSTVLIYK